jgi:hypothetical protein
MGVAGSRDELRKEFEYLVYIVVVPFLLRALGWSVLRRLFDPCCKKCCEKTMDEMEDVLNPVKGDGDSGVTWDYILLRNFTWSAAAKARGLNKCAAYFISTVVLVCWHWLQPLLYWLCLYLYWDLLDGTQQWLGCVVAGREGVYWLLTVIGCFHNPAYLLIDVMATWKDVDRGQVLIYIFSPEKYVYLTANNQVARCWGSGDDSDDDDSETSTYKFFGGVLLLILLDMFGVAALVAAIASGNMYPPMMIGYSMTTLGGLVFLFHNGCMSPSHFCFWLHFGPWLRELERNPDDD